MSDTSPLPQRDGGAPETFSANARGKAAGGAIAATIQIHIERYTPDFDRTAVETALKQGGYPAFVPALRKAPEVGWVAVGDWTFNIRWAGEQKTAKGRTIVVVTDTRTRRCSSSVAAPPMPSRASIMKSR